jgi:hypothetical protein
MVIWGYGFTMLGLFGSEGSGYFDFGSRGRGFDSRRSATGVAQWQSAYSAATCSPNDARGQ